MPADPTSPVIVPIRRGKVLGLGLGVLAFCITIFAYLVQSITHTGGMSFLDGFMGFVGLCFAPMAVVLLGMAWRAPVALRMDVHGISGCYAAPARWLEIDQIGVTILSKGGRFLGFNLKDPKGFRARQKTLSRFNTWMNGATGGYHINVPESVLKDTDMDKVLAQALAFQAAARTDPQ